MQSLDSRYLRQEEPIFVRISRHFKELDVQQRVEESQMCSRCRGATDLEYMRCDLMSKSRYLRGPNIHKQIYPYLIVYVSLLWTIDILSFNFHHDGLCSFLHLPSYL